MTQGVEGHEELLGGRVLTIATATGERVTVHLAPVAPGETPVWVSAAESDAFFQEVFEVADHRDAGRLVAVLPHRQIDETWPDFRSGTDRVLEWIESQPLPD